MIFSSLFGSGSKRFWGPLLAGALTASVVAFFVYESRFATHQRIAGTWGVEKSGSGLAVNWNLDAPMFHGAREVSLEIQDGAERRVVPLKGPERAGTLFYAPHDPEVTFVLHVQGSNPGTPERTEVVRVGSQRVVTNAPPATAAEPESTRARTEAPVSVWRVRALAPRSYTNRLASRGLNVPVHVKINAAGRVTEAEAAKFDTSLESALAAIARTAAKQWKFQPQKGAGLREHVIHFKFART